MAAAAAVAFTDPRAVRRARSSKTTAIAQMTQTTRFRYRTVSHNSV